MRFTEKGAEDVKIAYIGGGSRGWAWGLMSDLALTEGMSGHVDLYDIDYEAAKHNETIGNKYNGADGTVSKWSYSAKKTIGEALAGANFVVISILPATFDEMESDVHAPEKYGIYQPVGDTTGPGGVIRSLRTIPMMEEIARAVRDYAPDAWVINYTNPMAICVKALYDTFPGIKAFGCCHEVFGTQTVIAAALEDVRGIMLNDRKDVKVNVVGVNHFTWITSAHYRNIDLFPVYAEYVNRYADSGVKKKDDNWMNSVFDCSQRVKFDLFRRYGVIAAAGDRHLAEFCPGSWYLKSPEMVTDWGFALTSVEWRKKDLGDRLARSERLRSGEEAVKLEATGEDGALQMRALLGLDTYVTNVNIPNVGQIPNLPLGAVVETNAVFTNDTLTPVYAGPVPEGVHSLVTRIADAQLLVAEAGRKRDLGIAFKAFVNDPLMSLPLAEAKTLFDEMVENTKSYLGEYFK